MTTTRRSPDDIVIWPDGTTATLDELQRGDFNHMSDDYEIVSIDDSARLRELDLMPENAHPPAPGNRDHEALLQALEFVVLFLAFDGRDRGTQRMDKTLDHLSAMARATDGSIRAALRRESDEPHHLADADLLTRVRAALANPSGLSDAGRNALILDLDTAGDGGGARPRSAHIAAIQHGFGYDVLAAFGRARLDHMVAGFCRERWTDTGDDRDPATLDDATVTRLWFENDQVELKTMEIIDTECEPAESRKQEGR